MLFGAKNFDLLPVADDADADAASHDIPTQSWKDRVSA
jgi:hypothetical protein